MKYQYPRIKYGFQCLSVCVLFMGYFASAYAAKTVILPPPQKVSTHVYAWIGPYGAPNKENKGYRMNMAFVVGKNAVAVLESGYTEAMAKEMLQHIGAITRAPVKYVINSNSQPDRFMGNEVFRRQGATIVAHADEVKRMVARGHDYAGIIEQVLELPAGSVKVPRLPNQVITKDFSIDLGGGVVLNIRHFGAAHTPAPLVTYIPVDNVVYGGDILYSGRIVAIIPDGNVKGWIEAFTALRTFGDAIFVPGHGAPGKLSTFEDSTYQYLVQLNNHMAKMVAEGVDLQEAIKRFDSSAFSKLADFNDLVGRNANLTYLEREAESFGK